MANTFNISVKPEIAAAVVKIDANKAELDGIRATDIPGTNTLVNAVGTLLTDIHDTDLPEAVTKIDENKTEIDAIRATDIPGTNTKVDANKSEIDLISSAVNGVYPSDDILHTNASEHPIATTFYTEANATLVNCSGIIRIKFDLAGVTEGEAFGRIYINDIAVGTEQSQPFNSYQTYTEDLLVRKGDKVSIYIKHSHEGRIVYCRNLILLGVLTKVFTFLK